MRNRPRTDLEWLTGHFEAVDATDAVGRMTRRRPPGEGAPPRFRFARTRLGCLWRFAADEPPEVVRGLARYAALEGPVSEPVDTRPAAPERLEPMRRVLEAVRPLETVTRGLVYRIDPGADGRARLEDLGEGVELVREKSDPRLDAWAEALGEPVEALRAGLPMAVSTYEGQVVSCCRCTHGDAGGFVQAGVDTLDHARGHGHAPRVVAAWALAIDGLGGWPLFATEWSNRSARAAAQKLGLRAFADQWVFG